jgi:hypothetical protein
LQALFSGVAMTPSAFQRHSDSFSRENKAIYILGPNSLQNSLLASVLERINNAKYSVIGSLSSLAKCEGDGAGAKRLVLWDRFGKNAQECLLDYEATTQQILFADFMAFFNLSGLN